MIAVFLTVAALQGQPVLSAPPLQIESSAIITRGDSREIEFFLRNNSAQPVTAWKVRVTVTLQDGTTQTPALIVDGYPTYAGLIPSSDDSPSVIAPGAAIKRSIALQMPSNVPILAVVPGVVAAVFADRSTYGDPAAVRDIFQRRERDSEALALIVAALRTAHAVARGRDGLVAALEALNTRAQSDYDNPEKTFVRRVLLDAVGGRTHRPPDEVLHQLILSAEARWQALSEHRISKR